MFCDIKERHVVKCFAILKNVAHSFEPGETPSYSASHQAQNYEQHSSISQNRVGITNIFKLPQPDRNRIVTENGVNFIMCSTVKTP